MSPYIPAMERVPEPELMDGAEQAAAYAAADFSASDGAVIMRLGELFPEGLGPRLVDLGCGPGNISFRLAELRPLEQRWLRRLQELKGRPDARLEEFRWLLEELRVSLFAQELRTPQPVSVKRLEKVWAQMQG